MTTLAYTVPVPGSDLNSVADPEIATALTSIKTWANGNIDASNVKPLTGAAWIAPALINSWANAGGGFETVAYLKDPMGFVHLKGAIAAGATGTVAFVLPAGYRPGAKTDHPGAGTTIGSVQIDTSGNATINFSSGTGVGLSGITFLAEKLMKFPALPATSFEDVTLDFEQLQTSGIFWGSGVPTFIPDQNAVSFYLRKDKPTVANQRIYIYTGTAWTGIV